MSKPTGDDAEGSDGSEYMCGMCECDEDWNESAELTYSKCTGTDCSGRMKSMVEGRAGLAGVTAAADTDAATAVAAALT